MGPQLKWEEILCGYTMGRAKRKESTGPFPRLKGTENYKDWAREMGFYLQELGLMGHADGTLAKPELYTEEEKGTSNGSAPLLSDRTIERREEEVEKWRLNDLRTCGKIGLMCTGPVQQQLQFLGYTRTAKEMWDHLKANYTVDPRQYKWDILIRLENASYDSSKNMSDFLSTMRNLLEEINEASITMEDLVVFKAINSLGPSFENYVQYIIIKSRIDKKLPDLDCLFAGLEEEEKNLIKGKSLWINNVRSSSSGGSSRGGGRGGRSATYYKNATCHRCKKKGHIAKSCAEA